MSNRRRPYRVGDRFLARRARGAGLVRGLGAVVVFAGERGWAGGDALRGGLGGRFCDLAGSAWRHCLGLGSWLLASLRRLKRGWGVWL